MFLLPGNAKGYLNVFGGFLIHLTLGTFFTIGNMTPYLLSYLRVQNSDTTVTYSLGIWINALSYVGQGSLMAVGGLLEKKLGARLTCLIGCFVFCGGIAITSLTIKHGFIAMVITYGLVSCLGLSIAYIAPLSIGMRWFPQNKGLVNGIILSGYGLGALVFNQVQTALLNPKNISVDPSDKYFHDETVLNSIQNGLLYLGGIYGAIQIVGMLLLFPSPKEPKDTDSDTTQNMGSVATIMDSSETFGKDAVAPPNDCTKSSFSLIRKDLNPGQMLKRKEFYMFWCTFALHAQCVQFINTYYKAFGQAFITSNDHFLTTVGSIGSVCNCLGRIFWGRLQDKTSYKLTMAVLSGTLTVFVLTFMLVDYGKEPMFVVWVASTFFIFSGIFPIFASATALAFGSTYAGTNFGLVFTSPAISSIGGAFLIQVLLSSKGWLATFSTVGAMTFMALIITLFVPKQLETIC